MELVIRIDVENAAFDGDSIGPEAARILAELAGRLAEMRRLEVETENFILHDMNGNIVGQLYFEF